MKPLDPIFDVLTLTWEAAAQEAAFEGRCFCMLDTGHILNRNAMPPGTPYRNPEFADCLVVGKALRKSK
ncbi:hypothetical protein [Candidatus Burkholderia verschuerenii]|uniref:hypothetical protein n=1 Tax=Candidatus Burkholderia verschuerenii TaxID=242163 RepID=UPI00067BE717|nr:hypothetical protein [Candidatus Burkholderia verschuerenii]